MASSKDLLLLNYVAYQKLLPKIKSFCEETFNNDDASSIKVMFYSYDEFVLEFVVLFCLIMRKEKKTKTNFQIQINGLKFYVFHSTCR